LQESSLRRDEHGDAMTPPPIEDFLKLGPVGAALATSDKRRPRVLLIDELDKSDIDLPNDLLHVFEEGEFPIPELERMIDRPVVELTVRESDDGTRPIEIRNGVVRCREFPIVVMTSNDERDFPPAFRRRCLELDILPPGAGDLAEIVRTHLGEDPKLNERVSSIVAGFLTARAESQDNLATDQLLHAVFLALHNVDVEARVAQGRTAPQDKDELIRRVWRPVQ
jgi:MoxR-like ATPase